jgi:glutamate-ammonia-ligase adenylyltransferase
MGTGPQLALESPTGPSWLEPARMALARAPDPGRALDLATAVLDVAPHAELEALVARDPDKLAQVLFALCGVAPFLAADLLRHPAWLLALLSEDLSAPRTREALEAALDTVLATYTDPAHALRELKYYELARITVRDCSDRYVALDQATETLRALSLLADVLLDRALRIARAQMQARFGAARWRTIDGGDAALAFSALGLGKLGSEELNYSSDVDLVYVFEAPAAELDQSPADIAHAQLAPFDYFTRLAQVFGQLVSAVTGAGFLYRIDLDLRPEGAQGTLVVSDEALAVYYESWADTWEKAAFMKARPVAGDIAFGWRAIRAVGPIIYRSSMDYAAVESIERLQHKIEAAHGRRDDSFNVKLDAGGIRDIEFVAQALQLLHGGRIEQIRVRSTQEALQRLCDVRLLQQAQAQGLLAAYHFLRRLENRLQMVAEQQTHRLPRAAAEREPLARALGYCGSTALADFDRTLAQHRALVQELFRSFSSASSEKRIFELFARNLPQLLANAASRRMLENLSTHFTREIAACADPQRALNNLDRFIVGVGQRRFYFELLLDRPELVPRLIALFASSNYLSLILARHPTLIEPLFHDPSRLLLNRAQLDADFADIHVECRARKDGEDQAQLSTLRRFCYRQLINVGLLDLGGKIERPAVEAALTEIAEVVLAHALAFSRQWLLARKPGLSAIASATRFSVIGMGKLASRELSFGSDLDLIFLFDVATDISDDGEIDLALAQEYATRLGQRLISLLQTSTEDGRCYDVDARLRPSGNQGMLVTSLQAFARYHEREAQIWERMALLRARAVTGDRELGLRFEHARRAIVQRPLPAGARREVVHIRQRLERELAQESAHRRDFKRGRGGMLDVENVVQYLQLRHGAERADLIDVGAIDGLLERLAQAALLDTETARVLQDGWDFLRRLSSRLRVIENRSISDLDAERGDLESVARTLGYAGGARAGSARRALLSDYRSHTQAIRTTYERILGHTRER